MGHKFSAITPVERIKSVEVGGFTLTEFVQPPGLRLPRHAHECATILLTLGGAVTDHFTRRAHECDPSSILIRPAGEAHSHRYGRAGARCLAIEVERQRLEAIRPLSHALDGVAHLRGGPPWDLALRLYREFRMADDAAKIAIEGLVLEMIAQAARHEARAADPPPPGWLGDARDFIHEHFTERVGLSEIAAAAGVHRAHLAETFRRHYRCTVGGYIRRLRLEHAVRELTESEKPLVEIATDAGFYDQSHFTHALRRHTGMAPSALRSTVRPSKARTKGRRFSKPR